MSDGCLRFLPCLPATYVLPSFLPSFHPSLNNVFYKAVLGTLVNALAHKHK